jgi:hypothetical protein
MPMTSHAKVKMRASIFMEVHSSFQPDLERPLDGNHTDCQRTASLG